MYENRIVVDPEIMVGKPVIRGTRITVELILERLRQDLDVDELLNAFPRLTVKDVKAALEYAEARLKGEEVFPAPA